MVTEIRDRGEASRWLSSGLCLSRLVRLDSESVMSAQSWLIAALAEGASLPPAGVVADIGQMLLGRKFQLRTEEESLEPQVQSAVRRYEDHVLGRLVDDSRMVAAIDAVARLEEGGKAAAVGYLTARILHRISYAGVSVNQGLIRQLSRRTPKEIELEGMKCLSAGDSSSDLLVKGYEKLTRCAEEIATLIRASDVFTLENLLDLSGLSQRMAISQAVEAAEWLGDGIPTVIRPRQRDIGEIPTGMEDESTYPTGGFSSVTTVGSLENIVTSEFMYMERKGEGEADLFDLRYAEGELLYYTRDETVLVRRRRQIYIAIDDGLVAARVKDPTARWQTIVVLLGLTRIAVQRVSELLGQENLMVNIVFLRDQRGNLSLEPEMRLCALLLREWTELGLAQVWSSTVEHLAHLASEESSKGTVQVVLCGKTDLDDRWTRLEPDSRVSSCRLVLKEHPRLYFPKKIEGDEAVGDGSDWGGLATALLEYLWS